MKKLSFYLSATLIAASLAACGSDGSDCAMVGDWKVKSVDVKSDKLDTTILEMSKSIAMKMTYSFTTDSVTIRPGGTSGNYYGTFKLDEVAQRLSWNTFGANGMAYVENMKIASCGGGELTLLQRTPADTTQQALTSSTIVLEKVKK